MRSDSLMHLNVLCGSTALHPNSTADAPTATFGIARALFIPALASHQVVGGFPSQRSKPGVSLGVALLPEIFELCQGSCLDSG